MANSNNLGRAFEYICIKCLSEEIAKIRPIQVIENDHWANTKSHWEALDHEKQRMMELEIKATIPTLRELEPMIDDHSGDVLTLRLQSDKDGARGDVRDILLMREQDNWVIGISVKHNHFAVKHSRLSNTLDFGNSWLGIPCSSIYWETIKPIFEPLIAVRGTMKWSDLPQKEEAVYLPLLNAFIDELLRLYERDKTIPARLVEYLLGRYDFYKLIGLDAQRHTSIMSFNLRGTLNKASKKINPSRKIPIAQLPKRIISLALKPNSNNTAELFMDNGWQFSFRIHNASSRVEPSLKFDIQIMGIPTSILTINCPW